MLDMFAGVRSTQDMLLSESERMMGIDAELHPALAAALAELGQEGLGKEPEVTVGAGVDLTSKEWSISRFAVSGQFREFHSKVLGEVIILAADNAELPDFGDTVVYRAAEAQLLVGTPPEEVRAYHEVKVFFEGIIERSDPNETRIDTADLLPAGEGADDDLAQ